MIIAETDDELASLEVDWRSLAVASSNGFVTPEWFAAARRGYPAGIRPFVAALRSERGGAQAILPLIRHGSAAGSVLRFGGGNLGDMFAPLGAGEAQRCELAHVLAGELSKRRDWSSLILENVPEDAGWIEPFRERLAITPLPHRDEVLPYATIRGMTWDQFLAGRSRNFRSQLGRKQRRLERDHEVRYRMVEAADELPAALDHFARLHHARWDERGGSQALTDDARAFHADFAHAALERGWLRLWTLDVDNDAVAAWYGWRVGDRYAYYLAGFDPAWSRHSVGLLLQAHTLRAAIEEGASVYDLLLGSEEYKGRFANGEARVATYVVTRKLSRTRAFAKAEVIARAASDRLSPEAREKLKRRVGSLARRSPTDVKR